MDGLTARETRQALDVIRDLYSLRTKEQFAAHAVRAIHRLIHADVVSYNEIDTARGTAAFVYSPEEPPDIPQAQEILGQHAHQLPVRSYPQRTGNTGHAIKISDLLSRQDFRRTDLYQELYKPLRIPFTMSLPLILQGPKRVNIGHHREHRDFSERERRVINCLAPHLLQAYRNASLFSRLHGDVQDGHMALQAEGRALLTVLPQGEIRYHTDYGRELALRYDLVDSKHPHRLMAWLRQRLPAASNPLHTAPSEVSTHPPLAVTTSSGTLRISFAYLNSQSFVLLKETRTTSARNALAQFGLTPREAEILEWVAKGKSNPEIGTILGISFRTVQKHLERVYSRLGVDNRHAAITLALTHADAR